MVQVDAGVAQVVLRNFTANVVRECGECGAFGGQAALPGPWVPAEVFGDQADPLVGVVVAALADAASAAADRATTAGDG